jgi:hypothetical protein
VITQFTATHVIAAGKSEGVEGIHEGTRQPLEAKATPDPGGNRGDNDSTTQRLIRDILGRQAVLSDNRIILNAKVDKVMVMIPRYQTRMHALALRLRTPRVGSSARNKENIPLSATKVDPTAR